MGIPSTTWLGKLIRLPLRLIPRGTVVHVVRGGNRGFKWSVGSSVHGCWLGTYEEDKQALAARFVKPGMLAFDVGANVGFYTLLFSRLVGDHGRVWAFEPLAENARNLLAHLALNAISNVTVVQAAVSEIQGITGFQIGENNSMGSITPHGDYRVPTVALDDMADQAGGMPDVVKIDVEGAEALVLQGARRILASGKTVFFVAFHGEQVRRECHELLRANGYALYGLDGTPITSFSQTDYEIYACPAHATRHESGFLPSFG